MEFRILGPVEIIKAGEPVALDGAKVKTTLATLLLSAGRVVSDSQLSQALWGANPPMTMKAQLYTYVSRLRQVVEDPVALVRKQPGYLLRLGHSALDYQDFTTLAARGYEELKNERYDGAQRHLTSALDLWRGDPLEGVTEAFAMAELPGLIEARMAAHEGLIEAELALGRHRQLIVELTGLVKRHHLRERLRAQLMIALYRAGRQADALELYSTGRRLLADELGVDPGPILTKVFHAILACDPTLDPPAIRTEISLCEKPIRPATLPPEQPDFVGRRAQLTQLAGMLSRTHEAGPIVISGQPGTGKRALAVRVAHQVSDDYPDGSLHADLGASTGAAVDPRQILSTFLQQLCPGELPPAGTDAQAELYRRLLAERRMVIVLEDALDEQQLQPLLPPGESLVLVTSRRRLPGIAGARSLELAGLEQPEALDLLANIVGRSRVASDPQAAAELIERCGRLPASIRRSAIQIANSPILSLRHGAGASHPELHRERGWYPAIVSELAPSRALNAESPWIALQMLAKINGHAFSVVTMGEALSVGPDEAREVLASLLGLGLVKQLGGNHDRRQLFQLTHQVRRFASMSADEQNLQLTRALMSLLGSSNVCDGEHSETGRNQFAGRALAN